MGQSTLSRELALRIGLAARALPDTPKEVVRVLTELLGMPLTEVKLRSLTLTQYQQKMRPAHSLKSLTDSLAFLQAKDPKASLESTPTLGQVQDLPHSIRVAIASEDSVHIDGKFSDCRQFYIYQVAAREQRLIDVRSTETAQPLKASDKQAYRAEIVGDCQVLYSVSIGGPAAAKVIKKGVHSVKLNTVTRIADILEQLQHVLSTSPPPWLAKSMGMEPSPLKHSIAEEMT